MQIHSNKEIKDNALLQKVVFTMSFLRWL